MEGKKSSGPAGNGFARLGRLVSFAACLFPAFTVLGEEIHDPVDDAATLEFEQFAGTASPASGRYRESGRRTSATVFFPAGTLGEREAFGGIKGEWIDRSLYASEGMSGGLLQRYSLSAGMEVVKRGGQEAFAMVSGGYNGDFRRIDRDGAGLELVYAHLFLPTPALKWGAGMDLMMLLDGWLPYPLLFLEWWMLDRTKLRINGDLAEVRQFVGARACLTLGMRYNLFFGAVGRDARYRMEAIGAELGGEYRLSHNVTLRVKAKGFLWGEESLERASGGSQERFPDESGSLRLALAFLP